jgi:hypothetical protein
MSGVESDLDPVFAYNYSMEPPSGIEPETC